MSQSSNVISLLPRLRARAASSRASTRRLQSDFEAPSSALSPSAALRARVDTYAALARSPSPWDDTLARLREAAGASTQEDGEDAEYRALYDEVRRLAFPH